MYRCAQCVVLLLTFLIQVRPPGSKDFPRFVDAARDAGITLKNLSGEGNGAYILEVAGNGAGFFDYDNDEDMDVLIANGSTLKRYKTGGSPMVALYQNNGGHFTDITAKANLTAQGWGMGLCVADYDNDGDHDFYLTAYGPNVMFRNNGDGTFSDVTSQAGTGDSHWSTNCAFGDYDLDGDVDLYVANYLTFGESIPRRGDSKGCHYRGMDVFCGPLGLRGERDTLYRNNGDGTFTDVTVAAGIADPGYYGFGVLFADFNRDGWPDIYVANDSVPNLLFRNNRNGTFSNVGFSSGTALSGDGRPQAGMGATVGDYDGDGNLDIFVTNFILDTNTLYRNLGNLTFSDVTSSTHLGSASIGHMGWGVGFADLNNDGWQDLFVANGHALPGIDLGNIGQRYLQPKEIYRNLGDGNFQEIAETIGGDLLKGKSTRGLAFGDYDDDGDIDALTINMNDRPSLYRNSGNQNHWIALRLEGTQSNRDAIGARVEIVSGGLTQTREVRSGGSYLSHHDMRVHFGLGDASHVDAIRISWPGSTVETLNGVDADRFITVREGTGITSSTIPLN